MYAARSSGMKRERFGYVRGGYARVLERFGAVLLEKGVEIRLNASVESVERLKSGVIRVATHPTRRAKDTKPTVIRQQTKYAEFQATTAVSPGFSGAFISEPNLDSVITFPETGTTTHFDKVILTCPSGIAAKMLVQADPTERQRLENIKYQGIVCASVMTRCTLSPFYITNITDESPFTGVIEMTALVDKKHFNGNALVYLPKYLASDDKLFDKTDDQIERAFIKGLEVMYPNFRRKDVISFRISRVRQVFPLPVVNYSEQVPDMRSSVDGVYIVNSSHILNGTLNVNETVQLAERSFNALFNERSP
jgi:protoporphyrinogen oxidase